MEWGSYQIEVPTSAVFAVHRTLWNFHKQKGVHGRRPACKCRHWDCASNSFISSDKCTCADMHRNLTCSTWCRRLKNSSIRCLWWLECRTWYQYGLESILSLLVSYNGEFLDDDFGTNQMWNIGYQKSCPVVQTHSMCQAASVRRGSA